MSARQLAVGITFLALPCALLATQPSASGAASNSVFASASLNHTVDVAESTSAVAKPSSRHDHMTAAELARARARLADLGWACYDVLDGEVECILDDRRTASYFGGLSFQSLSDGTVGSVQLYVSVKGKYKDSPIEQQTARAIGTAFFGNAGTTVAEVAANRRGSRTVRGVRVYWDKDAESTFLETPAYVAAGRPLSQQIDLPAVQPVADRLKLLDFTCSLKRRQPTCTRNRFGMHYEIAKTNTDTWIVDFTVTTHRPVRIVEATRTAADVMRYSGLAGAEAEELIDGAAGATEFSGYADGHEYSLSNESDGHIVNGYVAAKTHFAG